MERERMMSPGSETKRTEIPDRLTTREAFRNFPGAPWMFASSDGLTAVQHAERSGPGNRLP